MKAAKNFSHYLAPTIARALIGIFVLVPVTTYYLEPKDFGVLAILTVITGILLPLVSVGGTWVMGANFFTLPEVERKELLFNILFMDTALRLLLLAFLWCSRAWLLPLVVEEYHPSYDGYFAILLASLLCSVWWPTVSYLLVIQRHSKLHARFEIYQALVNVGVMCLLLVVFEVRGAALFIAPLVTNACSLALELLYLRRRVTPRIRAKWIKEIAMVGMPSIAANTCEALSNSADRFFIQKWSGLSALGIYSHSQTYANIFKTLNKAFGRTVNPVALKAFCTDGHIQPLAHQIRAWYALLAAGGVLTALFAHDALALLTHGKFVAAAPLVIVWVYLMLSHTLGMPSSQFLLSRKAIKTLSFVQMGISLVSVGVIAGATFQFGIMGAAVTAVLANLCIQLAYIAKAKSLGSPYRDHVMVLLPAAVITLAALFQEWPLMLRILLALPVVVAALLYAYRSLKQVQDE